MTIAHEGGTWEGNLYHDDQGWWWRDETDQLHGPHLVKDEASAGLAAYIRWLTSEPPTAQ